MSCYLPQPPRAWSRVQNSCYLEPSYDYNQIQMMNKGNVLQYKANSSNLTKSQKYSKIATGQWINRNTTWATQNNNGYTNPNTTFLKRSGNVFNIAINPTTGQIIGPTLEPVTCPKQDITINDELPNIINNSGTPQPEIPPPVEPTPESNIFPPDVPIAPIIPIVIQDGGSLICSIQENVCTGETKTSLGQKLCNPTTDSDVPGPIQELCWNDGTQTWYPKQRYVMNNSTDKWPVNAQLFSSIIINAPVITSISSDRNIVTLNWTFNSDCLQETNFNVYQDGILVKVVDGNIFTTTIIVDKCNTYEYYIKAENITAKAISKPSNIVSIEIYYIDPPSNLSYTITGSGSIQLTWDYISNCTQAVSYNIYQNNTLIDNTTQLNYSKNGLINCDLYSYYVTSLDNEGNESLPSNVINVTILWPNPPTNLTAVGLTTSPQQITITWSNPNPNCSPPTSYNLYYSNDNITFNVITGILSSPYQFTPSSYDLYYFYMSSVNNLGESNNTSTVTASIPLYTITGDAVISSDNKTITFNGNGSIIFYSNVNCNVLIVGGGGGGGYGEQIYGYTNYSCAGGGGAGGLGYGTLIFQTNLQYNIDVGNGGLGGYSTFYEATNGSNSMISDINGIIYETAYGGGCGGSSTSNTGQQGNTGGNGGGSNYDTTGGVSIGGGTGSLTYLGSNGGGGGGVQYSGGGGGGGSIANGGNGDNIPPILGGSKGGDGGNGFTWSINGMTYGGGGGGGGGAVAGTGGSGGGGAGGYGDSPTWNGYDGTAGTGGGGGGSSNIGFQGGDGGSGVVIINIP